MRYCKNFNAVLVGENASKHEAVVHQARCKMWTCEYCAVRNALVWLYRIKATVEQEDKVWAFLTFTAPGWARTPEKSLAQLQKGWKKFREALRYRNGGKFMYMRVYELHENGVYHLHAVVDYEFDDIKTVKDEESGKIKYTYSRWIKDNAPTWGFGNINSAGNFKSGYASWDVAEYIAKYLTKGDVRIESGVRRFQASHGFAKETRQETDYVWNVQEDYNCVDLLWHDQRNFRVIDTATGEELSFDEIMPGQSYKAWLSKVFDKI